MTKRKRATRFFYTIPLIVILLVGGFLVITNKLPVSFFQDGQDVMITNAASLIDSCNGKRCIVNAGNIESGDLSLLSSILLSNSNVNIYASANHSEEQLVLGIKDKNSYSFYSWSSMTPKGERVYYSTDISFRNTGVYDLLLCKKTESNTYCDHSKKKSIKVVKNNSISEIKALYPGHNKTNANRINFVFVGSGYPSTKDFVTVSKQLLGFRGDLTEIIVRKTDNKIYNPPIVYRDAGLFAIEPLKSHKNKFNFWYLDFDIKDFPLKTDDFRELEFIGLDNLYVALLVEDPESSSSISQGAAIKAIYDLRPGAEFVSLNNKRIGSSQTAVPISDGKTNDIEVLSGFNYSRGDVITFGNSVFNHESAHGLFYLMHESECIGQGTYPNCASNLEEARSYWGNLIGTVDPFYYELSAFLNRPSPVIGATAFYHPIKEEDIRTNYIKNDDGTYGLAMKSIMRIEKSPIFGSVSRTRVEQVLNSFTGK